MRRMFRSKAWDRLVPVAILGAGVLALAGCATGYSFVQPAVVDSGGYYTSDGPYSGYYDNDAAGSYGPDIGDFGYDGFDGFGYDAVYGPSFTFGLGLGSACGWTCAGFYGGWPWYATGFGYPYGWGWHRTDRRHHRRHHAGPDPVVSNTSPHSWLNHDHPSISPPMRRGSTPPIAVPARPVEDFAHRRPLGSAAFAPHEFVRAPTQRPGDATRPTALSAGPAYISSMPAAPVFGRGQFEPRSVPMTTPHTYSYSAPAAGIRASPAPPPARARDSKIP